MTTVAWDGKIIATDSQGTAGSTAFYDMEKLVSVNGCMVATLGDQDLGEAFMDWFADGADPEHKPFKPEESEGFCAVVVDTEGVCRAYYNQLIPCPVSKIQAWGSGQGIVFGLMHDGKTAKEAMEILCRKKLDVYTGGKVQWATMEAVKKGKKSRQS